jgi:hypothetical protein
VPGLYCKRDLVRSSQFLLSMRWLNSSPGDRELCQAGRPGGGGHYW